MTNRKPTSSTRRSVIGTAVMLLAAALLTGCQSVLFTAINATARSSGLQVSRDVVYDRTHNLALDVYRPKGAHDLPTVVFFYGGSWKSGKRQWYRWVGEALAQRGLVVMIPTYRLWPNVEMDGFMSDGAHAVAWANQHAASYGGSSDKLFVMGHSAGAHIGALLATDAHWLKDVGMKPRDLQGFVGLAGPYDFLPLKDSDYISMFGITHAQQLLSQPVHFVNGDEPPMLLMQGTSDDIVAPKNARSLARALREQHEPVKLVMVPDIGHFAVLFSMSRPLRGKAPVLDDAVQFIHAQSATDKQNDVSAANRDAQAAHAPAATARRP